MLLRRSTDIYPKGLARDIRGFFNSLLGSRADILGSVGVEFRGLSDWGSGLEVIDIISDDLIALSVEDHDLVLTLAVLLLNRLHCDVARFGWLFSSRRRHLRSSRFAGSLLSCHIESCALFGNFSLTFGGLMLCDDISTDGSGGDGPCGHRNGNVRADAAGD